MLQKSRIFTILATVILTVLIFSVGFYAGEKSVKIVEKEVVKILDPKESELVEARYFNITGTLTEMDESGRTLTLETGSDAIKIKIREDSLVRSYNISSETLEQLLEQGKEPPIEIEFKDIKIGDKVSIFIQEQEDGLLIGTNVFIHFLNTSSQ